MKPTFEILPGEEIQKSMLRIMHEQYDSIIQNAKSYKKKPDKSVHEIRKSFKRIRAVLRLIRDAIGYSSYHRENTFCRDEAKLISHMRDLTVFYEDLAALDKQHRRTADLQLIQKLQQQILKEKEAEYKRIVSNNVFDQIITDVRQAKERIDTFNFRENGFEVISKGLARIYSKGRKELELVKREPTAENFHDLRKRVKYLMYHNQILRPLWPKYFKATEKMLDKAADQLGLDHNFAALIDFVLQTEVNESTERVNHFIHWLENLSRKLRTPALETVEIIYAERTVSYMERVKKYFDVYYSTN